MGVGIPDFKEILGSLEEKVGPINLICEALQSGEEGEEKSKSFSR